MVAIAGDDHLFPVERAEASSSLSPNMMTSRQEADITSKKGWVWNPTAERERNDTKVNTELSAAVNHLAKLNDSGDVKAMTDREKTRGFRCKTTKTCPFRLKANS